MVERTTSRVASAPVTASGTASSTGNGCTSDSNCDASTMNTTSRATPKAKYSTPPLSFNSRDSPASAVVLPGGNTCRESTSSESRTSPSANPGTRAPESVNDGTRLKWLDRKSTRLNSSHGYISYAVFCLKKKKKK